RLTAEQQQAVANFVGAGGGVWVVLGQRADTTFYNDQLFQDGHGWLPARLEQVASAADTGESATRLDGGRLLHPALEWFRLAKNALTQVRFPRWWRVVPGETSTLGAFLADGSPFLVEKSFKAGRVLLCPVPCDRSWESNLTRAWEFPILVNEVVQYLADSRAASFNVPTGEGLRYRGVDKDILPLEVTLQPPRGKARNFTVEHWPWSYAATHDPGVYRLELPGAKIIPFVVHGDPRESDLQPCTEKELKEIMDLTGMHEIDAGLPALANAADTAAHDLWWLAMVGVMLLLCGEIWLTRRMALAQGAS